MGSALIPGRGEYSIVEILACSSVSYSLSDSD
jgi:hypothetical protein